LGEFDVSKDPKLVEAKAKLKALGIEVDNRTAMDIMALFSIYQHAELSVNKENIEKCISMIKEIKEDME
jgi:hypothetical protein